jgi:hypothetical protein
VVDGPSEGRHEKERHEIDRNNRFLTVGGYTICESFYLMFYQHKTTQESFLCNPLSFLLF